ncbi:SAF domain-containing protein [Amycolatopsis sp. CA-230715]|uniref:SAF domain-containing protein n=1 Tax=Amycolatopsis sp. CA-230715 TaxID=2745196 RepID=UPI001C341F7F|nr:SAF domain-containing protein [Amycolatopsis sp. CA-230715]QWF81008.1 hypothetical protein HUW46_04433 [Amycolatopsis sp. CA-230715]
MTSTDTPARGPDADRSASWLDSTGAPARTRGHRSRRLPHLLIGVLLVVVCVGAAVWWTASAGDRMPVLVLARPVTVGQALVAADLRRGDVAVSTGIATVPADAASAVLGRPMATSLAPGALLTPDSVSAAFSPPAGRAVVGIGVKPGQFPTGLAAGNAVTVVAARAASSAESGSPNSAGAGTAWPATVTSVAPAETDQLTVVSLEVEAAAAIGLAQQPSGQLAVVLRPAGGER